MELVAGTDEHFWANRSSLLQDYYLHDWCVPKHDDKTVFELLVMEMASAGLNWEMILRRREALRTAFADYDLETLASWDEKKVEELMQDPTIIRNRLKIQSVISNARATLALLPDYAGLADYMWHFTDGEVVQHHPRSLADTPTQDDLSRRVSKEMKKRGFKFVGPVIVYNYLQACGIIDDRISPQ
jgi:DNA-3-methyladenine glycosylase I